MCVKKKKKNTVSEIIKIRVYYILGLFSLMKKVRANLSALSGLSTGLCPYVKNRTHN